MFASFGGEARESYERFGNQNFGLSVPSPNGYLLQRYLLHADVHLGSRLRLWTELNSSFENSRVGGPQPVTEEDKLDLHQGFGEFEIIQRPGRRRERARRPPGDRGRIRTYVFTTRRSERSLKLRRRAGYRTNGIMAVRCFGRAARDNDTREHR